MLYSGIHTDFTLGSLSATSYHDGQLICLHFNARSQSERFWLIIRVVVNCPVVIGKRTDFIDPSFLRHIWCTLGDATSLEKCER